jgi:hypothetical protein
LLQVDVILRRGEDRELLVRGTVQGIEELSIYVDPSLDNAQLASLEHVRGLKHLKEVSVNEEGDARNVVRTRIFQSLPGAYCLDALRCEVEIPT